MRLKISVLFAMVITLLFTMLMPVQAASVKEDWIQVWNPATKSYQTIKKGELVSARKITYGANGTLTVAGAIALNGGVTCDTNKFVIADTTGVVTATPTAATTAAWTITPTTTTGTGLLIDAQATLTTGALLGLTLDSDIFTAATGKFINCLGTTNHATSVFSITGEGNVATSGTLGVTGNSTLTSVDVGGGYSGASGATFSTAGVGQFNGALTTDSSITALSAEIGGGYTSTGVGISSAGVIQAAGAITSGTNGGTIGGLTVNGSTSGGIVLTPLATGSYATTISNANTIGVATITLPDTTCTLPGKGLANSWTGINTFNSATTSGAMLGITRDLDSGSTDSPVVSIVQDNTGDDQVPLYVKQDATTASTKIASFIGASGAEKFYVDIEGDSVLSGTFNPLGKTTFGSAATSTNCLLLGAGAPSGSEATTASADKNFVDFRCASTATSGWAHAGAFYIKAQSTGCSASALRGYAYADDADAPNTGEISGVYGIGEQHGGASGSIGTAGKLMGLRSRVTVPADLTISTGNYYGLLIETAVQSSLANATDSAYIKFDDPNQYGNGLANLLEIAHGSVGSGNTYLVNTNLGDAATTAGIKVKIGDTTYWLQLAVYTP